MDLSNVSPRIRNRSLVWLMGLLVFMMLPAFALDVYEDSNAQEYTITITDKGDENRKPFIFAARTNGDDVVLRDATEGWQGDGLEIDCTYEVEVVGHLHPSIRMYQNIVDYEIISCEGR